MKNIFDFYHYGMPRRSGRYPWGSGKKNSAAKQKAIEIYRDTDLLNNTPNEELSKLIGRLNLEKQLGDLSGESKRGVGLVKRILNKIGSKSTETVENYAADAVAKQIKALLDQIANKNKK